MFIFKFPDHYEWWRGTEPCDADIGKLCIDIGFYGFILIYLVLTLNLYPRRSHKAYSNVRFYVWG